METLDSNTAFKGIFRNWLVGGIKPIEKNGKIFMIYSALVNFIVCFVFPLSLIAQAFLEDDIKLLINNLSPQITIVAFGMKHFTMFFCQNNIRNVQVLLKKLDQRIDHDDERECIAKMIKFCAWLFKIYNFMYYSASISFVGSPLITRDRLVFAGWFPFDLAVRRNYWIAYIYQVICTAIIAVLNVAIDIYPPIYILVLTAHVSILRLRISRIGKVPGMVVSDQFVECIEDYMNILRLFTEISHVIQRTLFIQFIVTGFVLCIGAVNLLFFTEHIFEIFGIITYLGALILEVFPACLCMNRLMECNSALTGSLYECNWIGQDLKFQKSLIIFMQRTQKKLVMLAGNIVPIGLTTFLGIVKFSFSMFTLLSQLNK